MIDVLRVPQRLEQNICKAHGHQVLDGFGPDVVDAVNLILAEMRASVAFSVWAARSRPKGFSTTICLPVGDAVQVQPFRQIAKQGTV